MSRKSPAAESRRSRPRTVSANGPNAVISRSWSLIAPAVTGVARPARRRRGPRSSASKRLAQQAGLGVGRRRARALGDEVEGDVVVGAALHARQRHAGARRPTAGSKPQHEGVREPRAQPLHRLQRPARVGERHLHPGVLVDGEAGVGQQLVEGARAAGPAAGGPARRRTSAGADAAARRGRPATSPCGGRPRRRSRRAASRCSGPCR